MIKYKTQNIKFILKKYKTDWEYFKLFNKFLFYIYIYIYIYYVLKIIFENICKLIFSFFNKKVGI